MLELELIRPKLLEVELIGSAPSWLPLMNQEKRATPTTEEQEITYDRGYSGLEKVIVDAVTNEIDKNIIPSNIKAGVSILGVDGNVEPDKPDQTKTATPTTEEQIIRPDSGFELAQVTIEPIYTEEKIITPSNETQTVTPSDGKFISKVTVNTDENLIASNIAEGKSIFGVEGTANVEKEWQPPEGWWDIKSILANDTEDYPYKVATLITDDEDTFKFGVRASKAKMSDGTVYENPTTSTNHTWNRTKDKWCEDGYYTRYVIYYFTSSNKPAYTDNSFDSKSSVLWVVFNTTWSSYTAFRYKYQLQAVEILDDGELLSITQSYNSNQFFQYCPLLSKVPRLKITTATMGGVCTHCYSLNKIPDYTFNGVKITNSFEAIGIKGKVVIDLKDRTYFQGLSACRSLREIEFRNTENVNTISISDGGGIEKLSGIDFSSMTGFSNFGNSSNSVSIIENISNINCDFKMNQSSYLKRTSILNIFNALVDLTGLETKTVTLGSTNLAKVNEEEKAIAINKNWTLA